MTSRGLFGKKFLDVQERMQEIGQPAEDRVVVAVRACGVCGTDINFVRDWGGEPMALGHEIAAEVMEIGKNVKAVKPGDMVIVEDCSMCGTCDDCKSGHPELCRSMFSMEGQPGMGQYLSLRSNSLVPYAGLDPESACLTEPLAVSLTSVLNAQIPLGGSVAVLGNGPLGLMAASLAKLRGAGFVAITGRSRKSAKDRARFAAAEKMGCDSCIASDVQDIAETITGRFPKGVDRVIVSSPPESLPDALKVIRFGGIITFFGLHMGGRNMVSLDVNDLVFRKITLVPTFAEPAINFPVALRLLLDGRIDAKLLVTDTFGFSGAKAAMKGIIEGTAPTIKAVMLPDLTRR